ncbi:MAG: hypothetical protein WC107_07335 [Patescibacteria group bacterium]
MTHAPTRAKNANVPDYAYWNGGRRACGSSAAITPAVANANRRTGTSVPSPVFVSTAMDIP